MQGGRFGCVARGLATGLVGLALLAGSANAGASESDPWQKMNRGIFWFNERADIYLIAPVAAGCSGMAPCSEGAPSSPFTPRRAAASPISIFRDPRISSGTRSRMTSSPSP